MTSTLAVQPNFSLRALNSFGVDVITRGYLAVQSIDTLKKLRGDVEWMSQPRLVLGGGSNLLLTRDFDGLVLHLHNRGIEFLGADANANYVRASAGESWHGLVEWTLSQGFPGL
ncbi:MAG: FAD-binding protein, partial [Herbaspirillum sp.]